MTTPWHTPVSALVGGIIPPRDMARPRDQRVPLGYFAHPYLHAPELLNNPAPMPTPLTPVPAPGPSFRSDPRPVQNTTPQATTNLNIQSNQPPETGEYQHISAADFYANFKGIRRGVPFYIDWPGGPQPGGGTIAPRSQLVVVPIINRDIPNVGNTAQLW